ncbi:LysR substrate-binding domain-containing protein [Nannocystis pusilla]|uniref:LysR substrate-binding domain-containing protein n=1 Tax=Nannocystis pusilla TaxID=889268 RepID=UPI003B7A91D7
MIPTARGEQLLVPLRAALRDVGALLSNSARFDPAPAAANSCSPAPTTSRPCCCRRCSPACRRRRRVQLRVHPLVSDVAAPLETGAITVALGVVFENSPGLQQQALFSEEMVLVCRKGHPEVKRTIDLATYLRLRHVLVSVRGGSQSVVDEQLAELGHARQIALVVPHFLAAPLIVASSDLVLTTPARLVRRLGPALDLRTLAPPLAVPGFTVRQVWHERHQDDPGHLWLRQQIFAAAKTLATGKDGSRC